MKPKKFINTVTITGVDNSVSPRALAEIAARYPWIEWGILINPSGDTKERFPTMGWIQTLWNEHPKGRKSLHVCGIYKALISGDPHQIIKDVASAFSWERLQLNIPKGGRSIIAGMIGDKKINLINLSPLRNVIMQSSSPCIGDDIGNRIMHGVDVLYDPSGGRGKLPQKWPNCRGYRRYGFAGGLSPDNITEQLTSMSETVPTDPTLIDYFWIDAGTGLRDANDKFSVKKALRFLELVEPWVKDGRSEAAKTLDDSVRVYLDKKLGTAENWALQLQRKHEGERK